MKAALVLVSVLFSLNVIAGNINVNSSWDEILTAKNIDVDSPSVSFDGRSVSLFEACLEGDKVRTKSKVKIWRMFDIGDRTEFEVIGLDYLYTAIEYTTSWEFCRGRGQENLGNCDVHTENMTYDKAFSVKVRKMARGDRSFGAVLFNKDYTIQACN